MKKIFIISLLLFISLTSFQIVSAEEPDRTLNPELAFCLKQEMGEAIFEEISSGSRQPTEDEVKKGETCFKKHGQAFKKPDGLRGRDMNFSPQTAQCLESTLGANYKEQMSSVKSEQEGRALGAKVKSCFGGPPGGDDEDIPDTVKSCVAGAIGQAEATKLFSGQAPPTPGSATFTKIESAGCFKQFKHRGEGAPPDLPPEKRQCIEKIMGNLDREPTEEQRQKVGQECFGGQGPGGEGNQMPAELESCLQGSIGDKYKQVPNDMSEDEKQKAGECFQKNDFRPMGEEYRDGPGQGGQQMDEKTKSCIEKVTGQPANRPTPLNDEQRNKIGQECFARPAGQYGDPNQPRDQQNQDRQQPQNPCVAKIIGDQQTPPTPEQEEKIRQECSINQAPTINPPINQTQPTEPINQPSMTYPAPGPTSDQPPMPFGCADQSCVDSYCQSHPTECNQAQPQYQPPPEGETQTRFFFSLPKFFKRLFSR